VTEVVAEEVIGPRTLDLTIASRALGATVRVLLLLPPDWATQPERRWPVLYLLHGALEPVGYRSWTHFTDVEELTAGTNVLVVMPEGDSAGWYSNWWNHGRGGPPRWETFHVRELRRILEDRYRAGTERAVAGLSMGGFGAMSYAARHRGMFRAVAAFSAAGQTQRHAWIVQASLTLSGYDFNLLWGDPIRQARIWRAHDPYALARRLVDVPLFVSCGNGDPGPLDPPGAPRDGLEAVLLEAGIDLANRVRELGGSVTTDFYGAGRHAWPYWERALHRSFDMLMSAIGAE
jgi:S-formylglutathione hydrolase FrmB